MMGCVCIILIGFYIDDGQTNPFLQQFSAIHSFRNRPFGVDNDDDGAQEQDGGGLPSSAFVDYYYEE